MLDSLVLRTLETDGMRYMIDTYRDNGESLADDPDLALAAGLLEGFGTYSALLASEVESPQYGASGLLDEYDLLGTSIAHDEDGLYTVLVLVYRS